MRPRNTSSIGRPASRSRFRVRSVWRPPFATAEDKTPRSCAPAARAEPIRCAADRWPPEEVDIYPDRARPRLARSVPPDLANRVKFVLGIRKRSAVPGAGIGGNAGGTGIAGGLPGPSGNGAGGGGVWSGVGSGGGGRGAGAGGPSEGSQLGTSGVSAPWPPFAFEVPISVAPAADAFSERQMPLL